MSPTQQSSLRALQCKTIDGLQVRFAANDKKNGVPILLLSPLPESILAFLPTWDAFSELGPLVAADLPAFGLSESRAGVRSPEGLGEFVVRMLDAFGLEKPHVVAPDVGTPACLFAAANHPGIFKSMVIGSGATDHTDIGGILDKLVNASNLESYKNMTGEQFVRGALKGMTKYKLPDFALQDYLASYEGDRFWNAVDFIRAYPQSLPRLARRLPEISTPCQITVGRNDPFVPVSNAEGLRRGLPKSNLNVLECGHFVWEDAAAEYAELACSFITGGYAGL
jgi:pimeloyl-ACP methyl ester carboxylesterase